MEEEFLSGWLYSAITNTSFVLWMESKLFRAWYRILQDWALFPSESLFLSLSLCFPIFLFHFCACSPLILILCHIFVGTHEGSTSIVFSIFSATLFLLDTKEDWTYQLLGDTSWSHWVASVWVFSSWAMYQKLKIIPFWRSSIFICSIFCRSIRLSYSHFPLISLVFVACFSKVRHKRILKCQA